MRLRGRGTVFIVAAAMLAVVNSERDQEKINC